MKRRLRRGRSCWHIGIFIVWFKIGVVTVRAEVHEIGDVQVVFEVLRVIVLIIVHEVHVAIGSDADERIECLRWTDALVTEVEVVVTRRGAKYTSEHDVGVESVVQDFVAVLAIGGIQLCDRIPRTVVGRAAGTALVSIQRYPRNDGWPRPVEGDRLGCSVSDSDGFGAIIMNEDTTRRRNLASCRSGAALKRLGGRSA